MVAVSEGQDCSAAAGDRSNGSNQKVTVTKGVREGEIETEIRVRVEFR